MKTGFSYCLLVYNDKNRRLDQIKTFFDSKFLKSKKYGLIVRTVHKDNSETVTHIYYSNDLQSLQRQMYKYVSWYDYVCGFTKSIQGYISKI